jgi:hypothetical protein
MSNPESIDDFLKERDDEDNSVLQNHPDEPTTGQQV